MTSWCSVTISSKNRRNILRRSSTASVVYGMLDINLHLSPQPWPAVTLQ
jgi:hypothetical protein